MSFDELQDQRERSVLRSLALRDIVEFYTRERVHDSILVGLVCERLSTVELADKSATKLDDICQAINNGLVEQSRL
jgi:hypothetical protein